MYVIDVLVQNLVVLHDSPATFFIQKANEFKSSIWVEKEERRVNAKSLLGVLSLGIMGGTKIRIIAGGPDEEQAVEELVKLVESGFAEYFFFSIKTAHRISFGVPYFLTNGGECFESENENTQKKGDEPASFAGRLYYEKCRWGNNIYR